MWDENNEHDGPPVIPGAPRGRQPLDLDTLDDNRCKASSWRGPMPARPTYENHFGPGGYNRCVGKPDHANPTHLDEWGHVFVLNPFRVIRHETRK